MYVCTALQRKRTNLYVLRSTGNAYDVISHRRLSGPRPPNILDKSTPMETNKKRTWHPSSYDDAKKRKSATLRIHPWLHALEALQATASEGFAQGTYVAAMGFEPATLRRKAPNIPLRETDMQNNKI